MEYDNHEDTDTSKLGTIGAEVDGSGLRAWQEGGMELGETDHVQRHVFPFLCNDEACTSSDQFNSRLGKMHFFYFQANFYQLRKILSYI